MKKNFSAILSAALLLGSIGAAPVFAAETGSTQDISPFYGCSTQRLSDSDEDNWYCGRGRGHHGGGYGGGYGCDGDHCYYRNR